MVSEGVGLPSYENIRRGGKRLMGPHLRYGNLDLFPIRKVDLVRSKLWHVSALNSQAARSKIS